MFLDEINILTGNRVGLIQSVEGMSRTKSLALARGNSLEECLWTSPAPLALLGPSLPAHTADWDLPVSTTV